MNRADAGVAAMNMLSDVLDHLLAATTGYHHDGEDACHQHPLVGGEARVQLEGVKDRLDGLLLTVGTPEPLSLEAAARKYAGPATDGECGLAVAS